MEEIEKLILMRVVKKLKESLIEIRHCSRESTDVIRAKQKIEDAIQYATRALVKE